MKFNIVYPQSTNDEKEFFKEIETLKKYVYALKESYYTFRAMGGEENLDNAHQIVETLVDFVYKHPLFEYELDLKLDTYDFILLSDLKLIDEDKYDKFLVAVQQVMGYAENLHKSGKKEELSRFIEYYPFGHTYEKDCMEL